MENSYYSKDDVITHVEQTPAQEAALFKRFYAFTGDPKDIHGDALDARNELLTNNLRYAALTALRHSSRRQYHQELTSAANAGLLEALESRRYNPAKGRFTTFATKYILGKICAFFRVSCAVSFPAGQLPDWPEDGAQDADVDTLACPAGFAPELLDHDALHDAIATLPDKERQMIELIFFGGHNVSSASELITDPDGKVGVSRQWATELRDRALINLRTALGVAQPETDEEAA